MTTDAFVKDTLGSFAGSLFVSNRVEGALCLLQEPCAEQAAHAPRGPEAGEAVSLCVAFAVGWTWNVALQLGCTGNYTPSVGASGIGAAESAIPSGL